MRTDLEVGAGRNELNVSETNRSTEPSEILGQAYIEQEGLAHGFQNSIHPADEMFQLMRETPSDYPTGTERAAYFRSGREALLSLESCLAQLSRPWSSLNSVLEFACGFGRFTRHLVGVLDRDRIQSSDIMPEAVEFVAETFGVRSLQSTTQPADFQPDEQFDLIWVASLFSHLPRPRFEAWLERLGELLSDEGLLVFSTHGEEILPQIPRDPSGFTFLSHSESKVLAVEEYGSTFVAPEIVREIAGRSGLSDPAHLPRDLWGFQDLYIASRAALPRFEPTELVFGNIGRVEIDVGGAFWIDGWAADLRHGSPLSKVELLVDGRPVGEASLGHERTDVAEKRGRPGWSESGWQLHGRIQGIPAGSHILSVRGHTRSGRTLIFDQRFVNV